ncbi:hypothetical protein ASJ81_09455 [Methanosarcina spelaei]|uniref:Uncharacterized protein n=1 Tax=Methanosarcina spelaei TaxID=1036679 RepID=A0A2A2HQR2_9EURY|nr:hypothetical protein [Methanosarcina spelaei]PAV11702.1 hypothetical protein ASJ81_09455 [Methanosarcina spelaei]
MFRKNSLGIGDDALWDITVFFKQLQALGISLKFYRRGPENIGGFNSKPIRIDFFKGIFGTDFCKNLLYADIRVLLA